MPITVYTRGERAPDAVLDTLPQTDGGILLLGKPGIEIRIGLRGLSAAESQAARRERIRIGLLRTGDALVIAIDVHGLTTIDLPYDHRRVPPALRGLPDREPGQGYAPMILTVDTATGTVAAARMVSLTPDFADVLDRHVAALDARADAADWSYDADLARIYARYPQPVDILAAAEIVEIAGQPFPRR